MLSNTTRIAKNTLMLYFRQILIMLVSLYTVRVVLETLGAEDYGIYNVVAGVVTMFGFLNGAMTNATQRFLNFAMGQNDIEQVRNVYSVSFILHILIAIFIVILAETIGLWFFYNWINIPIERQNAAFFVYQFSIFAMVISVLQVPYKAAIIAYEKMSFFAWSSNIEVLLKLGTVFLLTIILFDKLIVYSFLVCVIGIILFFVHKVYCNKTFPIAHFRYCSDKSLFCQLACFSGWSIFGGFAKVSRSQGINILINIFHGVVVNAAMGIAMQINSAIYMFVTNFQTAFRPRIIQSYAARDRMSFNKLVFQTSKFSFFLLYLFILPLYLNSDFILQLWLKTVPLYTVTFTNLILVLSLFDALIGPLSISIQATGKIKKYQCFIGFFYFANIPISLLLLLFGLSPVFVLAVKIILNIISYIWQLFFINKRLQLAIKSFFIEVFIPIFFVAGISGVLSKLTCIFFMDLKRLIISCVTSIISIIFSVYFFGLHSTERILLQNWLKAKHRKVLKRNFHE